MKSMDLSILSSISSSLSSSQYLAKHEILKFRLKYISRYPLDVVRRRMQLAGAVSDGYKYR